MAAFSRTFWSYSTVAEVYTLNALLIFLTFLLLLRWRRLIFIRREQEAELDPRQRMRNGEPSSDALKTQKKRSEYRLLYLAAFLFGLALGVHHVTVALMLPAFAWLVYATEGTQFFKSRRLAICLLACLIGASVYIYIPWAAAKAPVLNWGNPTTLGRFWSHITGRQYQSNFSFSPDQVGREISSFMGLLFREFGWPWLPAGLALAGIGIVSLFRKDRALSISFVLMIACNLIFAMWYEISEDKDAYYLPTFLLLAIAAGLGVFALLKIARSRSAWIGVAIALLAPVASLAANFGVNNRHNFYVAEDYVGNIFRTVAPNGLLLTGDWQVASPMLYFQDIAGQRRDVTCIDTLLLRRSWYCEYLESAYPDLMRKSQSSVELFMEDLRRWEKTPEDFQNDPALVQRIEERYQAMIIALIKSHLPAAPVYVTQDVVLSSDPAGQPLAKSLLNNYCGLIQALNTQGSNFVKGHSTMLKSMVGRAGIRAECLSANLASVVTTLSPLCLIVAVADDTSGSVRPRFCTLHIWTSETHHCSLTVNWSPGIESQIVLRTGVIIGSPTIDCASTV